MDKFFAAVSKYIIFIPIAVIVLALIFKFSQTSKTIGQMVTSITPTPTTATKKTAIDLTGPYKCSYKSKSADINAYIKNNKVLVNVNTEKDVDNYFFDGDCLFADGEKKMCNLSLYRSLFQGMISDNPQILKGMVGQYLPSGVDFEEVLKTCKKEDFSDSVFD